MPPHSLFTTCGKSSAAWRDKRRPRLHLLLRPIQIGHPAFDGRFRVKADPAGRLASFVKQILVQAAGLGAGVEAVPGQVVVQEMVGQFVHAGDQFGLDLPDVFVPLKPLMN